ncbi:hypothetical protein SK128_003073, partial [Halocaridina rubra]
MGGTGHGGPIGRSPAGTGPQPPTVVTSHSSKLPSKQPKLSCLDEAYLEVLEAEGGLDSLLVDCVIQE